MRAIVAGGSMGGLFAGLLLRRLGWEVSVFERVGSPLSGRGAGIVTHPQLLAALLEAGVSDPGELGVAMEWRVTLDRDGHELGRHRRPQVATSWDRLFAVLRAPFPDAEYRGGRGVVGLAQDAVGVTVRLSDGSEERADLLIAADGFRSTLRAALLPEVAPRYAGYVGWRGMLAEAEMPSAIFPDFVFHLPPGEQIIGYPVAGAGNDLRPGHRRFNWVWYRPADEATVLPAMLTDTTGQRHELAIPPPLIAPATTAALRADAERLLPPALAEMVRRTTQPFLQPIYDLECPRIALGRVALVGDAAFIARPHVGAGVTKAAEDALALARALGAHAGVGAALAAYEAERLPVGRRIVAQARELGACIGPALGPAAERSRRPEVVMAETAVLDFLAA